MSTVPLLKMSSICEALFPGWQVKKNLERDSINIEPSLQTFNARTISEVQTNRVRWNDKFVSKSKVLWHKTVKQKQPTSIPKVLLLLLPGAEAVN